MIYGLDLFSGIGGLSIALEGIARPVAYCENDRFAQAVLLSRQRDGRLPIAPIWDDVRTLKANVLPRTIDIIYGGFPCQDISVAGTGKGLDGERSGLFFEITRLCRDIRPRFVFLENVPAITVRGLDRVLLDFTSMGYDARWTTLSAAELGAPHLRKRWFLLAYSNSIPRGNQRKILGRGNSKLGERKAIIRNDGKAKSLEDAPSDRLEKQRVRGRSGDVAESSWWKIEPDVCRVVDGVPFRVDRLRGLGNAVVPSQAREAFNRLVGGIL